MANIRAGTAYVDVALGRVDDFMKELKNKVEEAGRDVGKQLGDTVKKNIPPTMGSELGKELNKNLTKAFFSDAKRDMGAGFRALATGDIQSAKGLFKTAGQDLASAVHGGFSNGIQKISDTLNPLADKVIDFGARAGSAAKSAGLRFQALGDHFRTAADKMGFLSFQIQNFGLLATAAFTAPTAAVLGFGAAIGITVAADIENATNALKYLLPATVDVEGVLKRIQKIAIESPVFDTADLLQYAQTFTSAGVEINKTERFLKAFSNIALVTGTSTDKANLAVRAITQAFGKGKLMAEELNQQLGEAMPSVLKLLREELGVTQPELNALVKEGKITGEDLIAIFTRIGESEKFLKGAAAGAETLSGKWQQLKEQVQTQLGLFFLQNSEKIKKGLDDLVPIFQKLIKNAGPVFLDMIDLFADFVGWLGKLTEWYDKLTPGQQSFVKTLVGIALAVGPIVLILGTFMGALAGVAAGIAAVATPVGAIILGIIAFAAEVTAIVLLLKKFISGNSETAKAIRTAWNNFYADTIVPIIEAFKQLWVQVKEAFVQIKNALTKDTSSWKTWLEYLKVIAASAWAVLKATLTTIGNLVVTVIKVIGPLFKAIASFISGVIKIFKGLTDFIVGVFTGDWERAWKGIQEIWDGIWDAIVGVLVNVTKAIWQLIKGLVTSIIGFFKSLYNTLVGHSIIPDMVRAILSWFQKLIDKVRGFFSSIGSFFTGFYGKYVSPFINKISGMVNTVAGKFSDLVAKIKAKFQNFSLYNVGVNLMRGLLNGIADMAGALYRKASNIASNIINTFAGIFKQGSPSKVFHQMGVWNMEGLMNGMDEMLPKIDRSINSVSSMIPNPSHNFGSIQEPMFAGSDSAKLSIENYYANDNVDPWRQAEDWYFLVSARGGV